MHSLQDPALHSLQDQSLEVVVAERGSLQAQNETLARINERQERELETLRQQLRAGGGGANLNEPSRTPVSSIARSSVAADGSPLMPLSPLLVGLDESGSVSRGKAYWRRANMYLKIASIADYWQAASHDRRHVGTPLPGSSSRIAPSASASGGEAVVELELTMAPQLRQAKSRLEEAVRGAVISLVLAYKLEGSFEDKGHDLDSLLRAAAVSAADETEPPPMPTSVKEFDSNDAGQLWQHKLAAAREEATGGGFFRELAAQAPSLAEAIITSTEVVVDQNVPPLLEHLRTILHDKCASSVRQLQTKAAEVPAGVGEDEAVLKARAVMLALEQAIANVQEQFIVGLRAAIKQPVAAQLGKGLCQRLCEQAVAHRCDSLRGITTEEEMRTRIWEEARTVQR